MKRQHLLVLGAAILAVAVSLGIPRGGCAEERLPAVTAGESSSLSMERFYRGLLGSVGQFPGRLVDLRCDSNGDAAAAAHCEALPANHALVLNGDESLHPLVPGTAAVRELLDSGQLDDTNVTVQGKYYQSTGVILVGRIEATE